MKYLYDDNDNILDVGSYVEISRIDKVAYYVISRFFLQTNRIYNGTNPGDAGVLLVRKSWAEIHKLYEPDLSFSVHFELVNNPYVHLTTVIKERVDSFRFVDLCTRAITDPKELLHAQLKS